MIASFKNWFPLYKTHIIAWSIFILYESVIIGLIAGSFGDIQTYAVHYFLAIMLFYANGSWLLPALLTGRFKYFFLPVAEAALIVVFILTSYIADFLLIKFHLTEGHFPFVLSRLYFLKTLFRGGYFTGFSFAYYYIRRYTDQKAKAEKLEKERLADIISRQAVEQELITAQNAYLKAQINPHFLFNTLDFIYHSILEVSPNVADSVIRLSEMMRYAMESDSSDGQICLGDEIEQVENLIELSKARSRSGQHLQLFFEPEVTRYKFIPLVLLTLTENIFKHGELKTGDASISIKVEDTLLVVETSNVVKAHKSKRQSGKGLSNVALRLASNYNESSFRYGMEKNSNRFKTRLTVPLHALL